MSTHSGIQTTYTKSGLRRYIIEIRHKELNKYQVIRGDSKYIVEQKANAKMAQWNEMWKKKEKSILLKKERETKARDKLEKIQLASQQTTEAIMEQEKISKILTHTLEINDEIDWEDLKSNTPFPTPAPTIPRIPQEPKYLDEKYQPKFNLIDIFFKSRKQKKINSSKALFLEDHKIWEQNKISAEQEYQNNHQYWQEEKESYEINQKENNSIIDSKKESYLSGEMEAVLDYFDMVLSNSEYPDYFPQSYDLDFNQEQKILIVDYQLPDLASLPNVKEVKYIQSRDEFRETLLSTTQINKIYDNLLYQICIRTIHELFEADTINAITLAIFNGYVTSINPATGQENTACVISLQANQEEFESINLANIDPKACFKNLKGIGSSKLYSLTPIKPIMTINREDKRFVDSYEVMGGIDEAENIAAMDWEDFEHLVREIFEKEFASQGGEVKVTRASRDGGIDAVAFDPSPIRGGKIVIQAKRYTNTVGVSAVRDLYGSLINEGATKGILVSTADYGPDAYEFAKDKPITLLNGNNLLHLLEKHGHKAKIDLIEAKRILADKESE